MPTPDFPDLAHLRDQIANGEAEVVLTTLLAYANTAGNKRLRTEMAMLSGQWTELHRPSTTATQPREYLDRQQAKITHGLISVIDMLERDAPGPTVSPSLPEAAATPASALRQEPQGVATPPDPPPSPGPRTSRWKEIAITVAAVVAFLAGIAELSGYSLRDLFATPTPVPTTTPVTLPDTPTTKTPIDTPVPAPPPVAPRPKPVAVTKPVVKEPTPPATKLSVNLKTNKGTDNLTFTTGEDLEIFYRVTRPCTLRVLYKLADDEVVLIQDNLSVTQTEVGKWISLGEFIVSPPFGAESLHVFASSGPFPALTTSASDGYEFVTEGLPVALRKTRGIKRKFASDVLIMTTSE